MENTQSPTLLSVIKLLLASKEVEPSAQHRLQFWRDEFGDRPMMCIAAEDVEDALLRLQNRGRLRPIRGKETVSAGKPLRGSTINRFHAELGSIYRFAHRHRIIPRSFVSPTRGVEKRPEPVDRNRYLRVDEVDRLVDAARLVDRHWRKLPALIVLAFTTGVRCGNLRDVRWKDLDKDTGTLSILTTKNGDPHTAVLTASALVELQKLPKGQREDRIFGNKNGGRFNLKSVWAATCAAAGLPGRNFHQLRHGCASHLARKGVAIMTIAETLGHRSLASTRRYSHLSIADRKAVILQTFE